ncbi:hypothetical protein ACHAXT_005564 [Thalassiosira profunda]
MFTQSFANSDRQQARRASRAAALRRMEEAAAGVLRAETASGPAAPVAADGRAAQGTSPGFPSSAKARPWNATTDEESTDDYSVGPLSVGRASRFLSETQRAHEARRQAASPNSGSAQGNGADPRAPPPLQLSSAARQFLWDDNSVASGVTRQTDSRERLGPNLRDLQNSLGRQQVARNKGQGRRGARWSAINGGNELQGLGEGIWNALTGSSGGNANDDHQSAASSRSGRSYRDAEGERLLNLASQRLHSPVVENLGALNEEAKECGEVHGEIEDDDDSFTRRRVFLDREGNMTFASGDYSGGYRDNGGGERNGYRRLKRPLVLLCAAAAVVGVCVGAATLYSRVTDNMARSTDGESFDEWQAGVETAAGGNWGTDRPNDNEGPRAPPAKARLDHLRFALLHGGFSTPTALEDEQSAQYAALQWLARDDPRQMDPESVYLPQRFGLAALWFATIGEGYGWHLPGQANDDDKEYGDDAYYDDGYDDAFDNEGSGNRRKLKDAPPASWNRHDAWMSGAGVCGWHGVRCHPREDGDVHDPNNDGDVSHLELRGNNLRGLIPEEIYATLPYLKVLDLSGNGLAGTLSADVAQWERLESLNLTANDVAGALPPALGELPSLKELHLADNMLGGSIPHSIGKLQKLRRLDVSGNSLGGTLPYQLGRLARLSALDLSGNLLQGPVPHEFSELQTLLELDLSHNDLEGPLFAELGDVTYLTALRLNDNRFDGTVPSEIGQLIHLGELRLDNNQFEGSLPKEISRLQGLDVLNVAHNRFRGEFPPEWTELAGLRELDISSNALRGPIPMFVDGLTNLRVLNLAHNDLTAAIPSAVGRLYKLEYLHLDNNEFEGTVPEELGDLANLKTMALHNNYLIGDVGGRICKLADELFLTRLTVDCGGEAPEVACDCCSCHDHEPIVHLAEDP